MEGEDISEEEQDRVQPAKKRSVLDLQVQGATERPTQRVIDTFRSLLIQWIVVAHIAFSCVELPSFQNLIQLLNPVLFAWLFTAGNSIRRVILQEHQRRRLRVIDDLQAAKSKIHLSFDLWSSPNSLALCGVVAHYLSSELQARALLISMKRVEGDHSGENIAEVVINVIQEYGIKAKIGYIQADNAGNNDTCVTEIFHRISPLINPLHRRLRCHGHIINLAAKAFLFGDNSEAFELDVNNLTQLKLEIKHECELLALWRKRGSIGKLHNIVLYIRRSPQRRQAFQDLGAQDDPDLRYLILKADNTTRWNSTYLSLQRALRLRARIMTFCSQNEEDLKDDTLTRAEWEELHKIETLLKPFYTITKRLEGNAVYGHHGSIWEALPAVEYLMQHLENAKEIHARDKHLSVCINLAWEKLQKYYILMDDTPVYVLGVFLHPKHRWSYFQKKWDTPDLQAFLQPAKDRIQELWEEEYKNRVPTDLLDQISVSNNSDLDNDPLDMFLNEGSDTRKDELEIYTTGEPAQMKRDYNLFLWWSNSGLTQLAQMAYDILSIPAMSSETERVFSGAKLTISPNRNRLSDDIIEATECLNNWYKAEI